MCCITRHKSIKTQFQIYVGNSFPGVGHGEGPGSLQQNQRTNGAQAAAYDGHLECALILLRHSGLCHDMHDTQNQLQFIYVLWPAVSIHVHGLLQNAVWVQAAGKKALGFSLWLLELATLGCHQWVEVP